MHLTLNLFGYSHNCITVCCFVQLQSLLHPMLCLCNCNHYYIPCCVWCLCNCSHYYKAAAVTVQPVCLCKYRHPTLCLQLHPMFCIHARTVIIIASDVNFVQLPPLLCCLCEYSHRCILCCIFAQSAVIAFCATIAFCVISAATVSRTCIVTLMPLLLWSSWLQFLW